MNHKQTIDWWKEKAPTYFTDKVFSFSQPQIIERLKLNNQSKILEIGFGYGRELSQFCQITNNVCGVELSQYTCELATKCIREQGVAELPRLKTYDGKSIPFENNTFDLVYSCFVLQHMSRQSARDLVKEALRVTKNTGKVLMEFFGHPSYLHETEDCFSGVPNKGGMYNNAYDWAGINALLLTIGKIEWIEPQRVSDENKIFDNYWVCITREREKDV